MATWILPKGTLENLNAVDNKEQGDIAFVTSQVIDGVSTDLNEVYVVQEDGGDYLPLVTPDISTFANAVADRVVTTDDSGSFESTAVDDGQLLGRAPGGELQGQKLHASMVDEDSLPLTSLNYIPPGHVLGVAETEVINPADEPVTTIPISEIKGVTLTSSEEAPSDPDENDLWYYNGAEDDDNARLYIYQDGLWIDASPGVISNTPGPQGATGPQGEMGETGRSVATIEVVEEPAGVLLEFYDEDEALIDDALIPQSALSGVTVTKQTGAATVDTTQAAYKIGDADGFDGFTLGTTISEIHTVVYGGFVLLEGVDYTINEDRDTVTIVAGSLAVLTDGQTLYLVNHTLS